MEIWTLIGCQNMRNSIKKSTNQPLSYNHSINENPQIVLSLKNVRLQLKREGAYQFLLTRASLATTVLHKMNELLYHD